MAAPSQVSGAAAGVTDAGGAWTYTPNLVSNAGHVAVVAIFQDGTTTGAVTVTGASNIEDLAGTDNQWTTVVADSPCGGGGLLHVFIGRCLSTTDPTISGGNSTSEDLYMSAWLFQDVSTGTTLATVIENGSAGATANGQGTATTTISDTGVTTLGADRLALNIVGANDDGTGLIVNPFTGESGGNWGTFTGFESSSGTDGSIYLINAAMASAGTINGGAVTSAVTVSWGNVGFALIGTTPDTPLPPMRDSLHLMQAVNRSNVY